MNGDVSETLFVLTFATLPYNKITLKTPYSEITFPVYLPSPQNRLFICKNRKIPPKLFFDSPDTKFGDKDKYAHFFGNAFLSYNFNWFNLTKFMSIFVEYFEGVFSVEGAADIRDVKVNLLGEAFGDALNCNSDTLPSEILNLHILLNTNLMLK